MHNVHTFVDKYDTNPRNRLKNRENKCLAARGGEINILTK